MQLVLTNQLPVKKRLSNSHEFCLLSGDAEHVLLAAHVHVNFIES